MNFREGLHGPVAIALLGGLLLTQEAGVPLPLAPGELPLLAAGLLIAAGGLEPYVFIPGVLVACIAGSLVGYAWARAVGDRGLQALARRIHRQRALERVSGRVRSAGWGGVAVSRLSLRSCAALQAARDLLSSSGDELTATSDLLRALSDPERLRIVSQLLEGPRTVPELATLTRQPSFEARHQLERLSTASALLVTGDEPRVTYLIGPDLGRALTQLLAVMPIARPMAGVGE